jgi:sterol desaturase/sphingolipid hydroxylase (fatty acid hydroxylase superfamily)
MLTAYLLTIYGMILRVEFQCVVPSNGWRWRYDWQAMNITDVGTAFSTIISAVAHKVLAPTYRLHWIYLLSALIMAFVAYWASRKRGELSTLSQFLFPRGIWLHPSAITDYFYVALIMPLWSFLVVPNLVSSKAVTRHLLSTAQTLFGPHPPIAISPLATGLIYTVALIAVADFKLYWVHRLMHRIPALWEFHKVHHSAEVLTPITFYRSHPVDMLGQTLAEALASGTVTAVFLYIFGPNLTVVTILGVNAFRFAFYIFGANLRHSHIRLSFGSTIEHFVISPAQHQVHHSADPKHFNRNFSSEFAIWDWMFGTLYCARREERITLGLGSAHRGTLRTVRQLVLIPFYTVSRIGHQRTSVNIA